MATSLEKLVVSLEAESARYQRELDSARKKLAGFEKDTNAVAARIGKQFGSALAAGFTVQQVKQWADSYTNLQNRLRLVTDGEQQLVAANKEVFEIAQRSRTELGATGELYQKIAANSDSLGISQAEAARATESFVKSIALSGTTTQAAAGGITQFGQALAAGIVRAEEFNSMVEAAPAFIDALAKSLGKTRGELRAFVNDGKLQSKDLIDALLSQATSIDEQYSKTTSTIEQSLTRVGNSMTKFVGNLEKATGIFAGTADLINGIADAIARVSDEADSFKGLGGLPLDFTQDGGLLQLGSNVAGLLGLLGRRGPAPAPVDIGMSMAPEPLDPEGMSLGGISYGGYTLQEILAMERANEERADALKKSASASASSAKAIQSNIDALVREAATLGMTNEQITMYELAQQGATDAQIKQAEALARSISLYELEQETKQDAADEQQRVRDMAKSYLETLDQMDGGVQAYRNEQEKLNLVLKEGWINQEQYNRLLHETEKQFSGLKDAADFAAEGYDMFADAFGSALERSLTDFKSWKDTGLSFLKDIGRGFAKLAADMAKQALFGAGGTGAGGGINWGGILGKLAGSLFGGLFGGGASAGGNGYIAADGLYNTTIGAQYSFASGGMMPANRWSLVGENGPELVMSHSPARVFNNDDTVDMLNARGGTNVYNNWTFNTPNADSFQKSRRQIQRREKAMLGVV